VTVTVISRRRRGDGYIQENLYDGEGLRAGINNLESSARFVFYNGELLTETKEEGDLQGRYVLGYGVAVSEVNCEAGYHAYHLDEQNSTVYITGNQRQVENAYAYDVFGNLRGQAGELLNRILYTGQQYDQEMGQYYLRARYYNPVLGRFTQEDVYRGDGLNLYAYCQSNPVKYYDPSGYKAKTGINMCPNYGTPNKKASPGMQNDDYMTLYHATSNEAAASIYANGVDLDHANRDMDFGRGFYVTDDISQAQAWINRKFGGDGTIIEFNIPTSEFNLMNNKFFNYPDSEWENFVRNSRNGMQNGYDTISGPMLANPGRPFYQGKVSATPMGQQTAFNSQTAVGLLNKYMSR